MFGMAAFSVHAATITVNSTADNTSTDGVCTLREAILASNAGADGADCVNSGLPWGIGDEIAFGIAGAGPHTIQPTSALPAITRTVRIRGYTQAGAATNTQAGMAYPSAQALDAQIMIELDGSQAGAGAAGLVLNGGSNDSWVEGLAIFNFAFTGIQVNSTNNLIRGNFVGVRANGTTAGGGTYGVALNASNNSVGGSSAGVRNLIAGNAINVSITNANGNLVAGNLIGTDRTGTVGLCSGLCDGVSIAGTTGLATSNTAQDNVIAGQAGNGIALSSTSNTGIYRNTIGIAVGGAALGNMGGVSIASGAGGNTITTPFSGNGIANSTAGDGILVSGSAFGDPANTNIDYTNAIWNNARLAINLRPVGEATGTVTANDALDADAGPNGLQNFPDIVSATVNGTGGIDISFTLNSAANTMYEVRAYSNPSCDPSGYGEGQYVDTSGSGISPTTDGSGFAAGTLLVNPMPANWGAGQYVVLTARNTSTSNSSEFSACVQVAAAAGVPPAMGDVPDQNATVGMPFSLALAGYVTLTGNPIVAGGYAIASGALPPGLALDGDTGVISGTPTTAGAYNVTVTASDTDGASNADAIQFAVAAAGPLAPGGIASVPTLSEWGLILLSLLLAGLAMAGRLENDTLPGKGRTK